MGKDFNLGSAPSSFYNSQRGENGNKFTFPPNKNFKLAYNSQRGENGNKFTFPPNKNFKLAYNAGENFNTPPDLQTGQGEVRALNFRPSFLEDWYRGYSSEPKIISPIRTKAKSVFIKSLQLATIVILIIIAVAIGGFVFLDRKLSGLEATQASLNRMGKTLVEHNEEVFGEDQIAQAAPEVESGEGKAIVPQIRAKTDTRVFNTSGNTNVDSTALPPEIDTDQDGLSDEVEEKLATNPFQVDTDGDGYPDGVEVKNGYDPLEPATKRAPQANANQNSNITPEVASASSHSSCGAGSEINSLGESCGMSYTSSSIESDFSNLTSDDYSSLEQMGLSEEDISKVTARNLNDPEKLQMQEKILGSEPMQNSIASMINSIPIASLPEISDSELKLFDSNSKAEIEQYFEDVNQIFEKDFGPVSNMDSELARNNMAQGNYTELNQVHSALEAVYQDLRNLSVPRDVKEIHKALLVTFRVYADIISENYALSQNPDSAAEIISKIKSFSNLDPLVQKNFQELKEKYNFE